MRMKKQLVEQPWPCPSETVVYSSQIMGNYRRMWQPGWQSLKKFSVWAASVFWGVIGAINSLLLVSEARDIFITGVLRQRLFNLKKESKFRMEIAHHHRSISAAETHYSLPVNLSSMPGYFKYLEWGRGSKEKGGGRADRGTRVTNTLEKPRT